MTAATLSRPAPSIGGPTDEDEIHLWCCDRDRALCGVDLTDHLDEGDAVPDERRCAVCRVIDDSDMGCGMKGCSG